MVVLTAAKLFISLFTVSSIVAQVACAECGVDDKVCDSSEASADVMSFIQVKNNNKKRQLPGKGEICTGQRKLKDGSWTGECAASLYCHAKSTFMCEELPEKDEVCKTEKHGDVGKCFEPLVCDSSFMCAEKSKTSLVQSKDVRQLPGKGEICTGHRKLKDGSWTGECAASLYCQAKSTFMCEELPEKDEVCRAEKNGDGWIGKCFEPLVCDSSFMCAEKSKTSLVQSQDVRQLPGKGEICTGHRKLKDGSWTGECAASLYCHAKSTFMCEELPEKDEVCKAEKNGDGWIGKCFEPLVCDSSFMCAEKSKTSLVQSQDVRQLPGKGEICTGHRKLKDGSWTGECAASLYCHAKSTLMCEELPEKDEVCKAEKNGDGWIGKCFEPLVCDSSFMCAEKSKTSLVQSQDVRQLPGKGEICTGHRKLKDGSWTGECAASLYCHAKSTFMCEELPEKDEVCKAEKNGDGWIGKCFEPLVCDSSFMCAEKSKQ
ncbi:unnamed protein product [Polarella glacialis]|uniref:Uncharacterized protein n=1 Tax=Polarella glacialis TaxID=89957 RepID=A0A813FME3_POLGL|nr:unnamed protein product [Polarella glacialis]